MNASLLLQTNETLSKCLNYTDPIVCDAYLEGIGGGVAMVYWRNLVFYMIYFAVVGIYFGIFHFYELHKSKTFREQLRVKTMYAMFVTIFAIMILHGMFVWYYAW